MTARIMLALVLLAGGTLMGCEKAETAAPAEQRAAPVSLGFKAECPLCDGHQIDVTSATPKVEFSGTSYYFCSDECMKEFSADPAKSVAALAAKGRVPSSVKPGATTMPSAPAAQPVPSH